MWEVWDLSHCILSWVYKLLTGKSGFGLISWRVSPLSDRSHISAENPFFTMEDRNAFLTGFRGPEVMKLTQHIIDFVKLQLDFS